MTKSRAEEALTVLWFILASQTDGFVRGFAIGMGLWSFAAATYFAIKGER